MQFITNDFKKILRIYEVCYDDILTIVNPLKNKIKIRLCLCYTIKSKNNFNNVIWRSEIDLKIISVTSYFDHHILNL